MIGVPAVVVGGHGQGGVGDLRFAGQASLGVVGHADHAAPPAAVEVRFRPGGKGWTLHAEVGAASVELAPLGHQAVGHVAQQPRQAGAEGIRQGHMGHGPLTEKAQGTLMGAIDELIGHQHVQWSHAFMQGSHRGGREDPAHSQGAHGPDVGPIGHLGGCEGVVAAVAGQEHHLHAAKGSQAQAVGGLAEGGFDHQFLHILQTLHGVEAAAPQHPQPRLG